MPIEIQTGDCRDLLKAMPDESVHCVVTSPPYWGLRDYGVEGQIGLEATFQEHIDVLVEVFRDVRRVLREDGTLWLNYGDSYCRNPQKGGSGPNGKEQAYGDGAYSRAKSADLRQGHDASAAPGLSGGMDSGSAGRELPVLERRRNETTKEKDLLMMPARLAFALQADGWWVRSDIIWHKPNPMPESVKDRPTNAHEHIFLMSKAPRYYYDAEAVKVPAVGNEDANGFRGGSYVGGQAGPRTAKGNKPRVDKQRGHDRRHAGFNDRWDSMTKEEQQSNGANLRNVWEIATAPFSEAHFATFPPKLAETCIKAGCPEGGTVLDPFGGSGTVGMVADRLGKNAILIEMNPEYAAIARNRIEQDAGLFAEVV